MEATVTSNQCGDQPYSTANDAPYHSPTPLLAVLLL